MHRGAFWQFNFRWMTVINPPDWKLANRTFVQCREQGQESHYIQPNSLSSILTSKGLSKVKIATAPFNAIKYCD